MNIYSKAIFGSSMRADFDKYSDKDLLIVANDYRTLDFLQKKYNKNNDWSVSYYTYSKLNYISSIGGLFIQHLKDDALIINDFDNKLKKILLSYKPKPEYKEEMKNSKKIFSIGNNIFKSEFAFAWICDVFYVGLRNYLIFKNAENEVYEFSFNKLLKRLKNEGDISQSEFQILKQLRVIKRNYRSEITNEYPNTDYIENIIKILKNLNLISEVNFVSRNEFQIDVEKNIFKQKLDSYSKLRLLEGYYLSFNVKDQDIKKYFINPQIYSYKFNKRKFTKEIISKIKVSNNYEKDKLKCLTK